MSGKFTWGENDMLLRWLALIALIFCGAAQAHDRDDDSIECRSRNYQHTECAADFRHPELVQQLSDSDCTEGDSWGYDRRHGAIWVSKGCAGVFADRSERYGHRERDRDDDDRDDRRRGRRSEVIECRSTGYQFVRCEVDWREARLIEQLSDSNCVEGRSWGLDDDGLWVDKGCAGRFSGH